MTHFQTTPAPAPSSQPAPESQPAQSSTSAPPAPPLTYASSSQSSGKNNKLQVTYDGAARAIRHLIVDECQEVGFYSAESNAMEKFEEMVALCAFCKKKKKKEFKTSIGLTLVWHFPIPIVITELANITRGYADVSCRSIPNARDVITACEETGFRLDDLRGTLKSSNRRMKKRRKLEAHGTYHRCDKESFRLMGLPNRTCASASRPQCRCTASTTKTRRPPPIGLGTRGPGRTCKRRGQVGWQVGSIEARDGKVSKVFAVAAISFPSASAETHVPPNRGKHQCLSPETHDIWKLSHDVKISHHRQRQPPSHHSKPRLTRRRLFKIPCETSSKLLKLLLDRRSQKLMKIRSNRQINPSRQGWPEDS